MEDLNLIGNIDKLSFNLFENVLDIRKTLKAMIIEDNIIKEDDLSNLIQSIDQLVSVFDAYKRGIMTFMEDLQNEDGTLDIEGQAANNGILLN